MRTADIYVFGKKAGTLSENDDGRFVFMYDASYLRGETPVAVSNTMPLRNAAYEANALFPFFDGLIPEGWLLDIAGKIKAKLLAVGESQSYYRAGKRLCGTGTEDDRSRGGRRLRMRRASRSHSGRRRRPWRAEASARGAAGRSPA